MALIDDLLEGIRKQMADRDRARLGEGRPLFGESEAGVEATGFVPDFLRGAAAQGGGGLGDFFAQAFAQLNDPRQLNRQLGNIGQVVAGRARKARSVGKFKGSPIGEALAGAIEVGGQSVEQQARLDDRTRRLQEGLGLVQGFSGAVTNPLLSILGLSLGDQFSRDSLAEQARQFNRSQPSTFDKILGSAGGILGGLSGFNFCWVAREVLGDNRWLAAREFMINEAPDYVKRMYADHGEELAERVANDPETKAELLPVFEEFARRGQKYLED